MFLPAAVGLLRWESAGRVVLEGLSAKQQQAAAGGIPDATYAGLRVRPILRTQLRTTPRADEPLTWRGFFAPGGISDEAYAEWVERLRTVGESAEWAEILARAGLRPWLRTG